MEWEGRRQRKMYKEPLLEKWKGVCERGERARKLKHECLCLQPYLGAHPVSGTCRKLIVLCMYTWWWSQKPSEVKMTSHKQVNMIVWQVEETSQERELVHIKTISWLHWPEELVRFRMEGGGTRQGTEYSILPLPWREHWRPVECNLGMQLTV